MSCPQLAFLRAACSLCDIAVRVQIGKSHPKMPYPVHEEREGLVALGDMYMVASTFGY